MVLSGPLKIHKRNIFRTNYTCIWQYDSVQRKFPVFPRLGEPCLNFRGIWISPGSSGWKPADLSPLFTARTFGSNQKRPCSSPGRWRDDNETSDAKQQLCTHSMLLSLLFWKILKASFLWKQDKNLPWNSSYRRRTCLRFYHLGKSLIYPLAPLVAIAYGVIWMMPLITPLEQ